MDVDKRLRWMEARISSSLACKEDELASLFTIGEKRNVFLDFCQNEERRNLFVFCGSAGRLEVSPDVPNKLHAKALVFVKHAQVGIVSKENVSDEVLFTDVTRRPIDSMARALRQVFLPLLLAEHHGSDIDPAAETTDAPPLVDGGDEEHADGEYVGTSDLALLEATDNTATETGTSPQEMACSRLTAALLSLKERTSSTSSQTAVKKTRTGPGLMDKGIAGEERSSSPGKDWQNEDRLVDILHRLLGQADVNHGLTQGQTLLSLPSFESVLGVLTSTGNAMSVCRVLEMTVMLWNRTVKSCLEVEPKSDYPYYGNVNAGLENEHQFWLQHQTSLISVLDQLAHPIVAEVEVQLQIVGSRYSGDIDVLRTQVEEALLKVDKAEKSVNVLRPWLAKLKSEASKLDVKLTRHTKPLRFVEPVIHLCYRVWSGTMYYHVEKNFRRLLTLVINDVLAAAQDLVKTDIFLHPDVGLLEVEAAMHVCRQFRGKYLDKKEVADEEDERLFKEDRSEFQASLPPQEKFPWPIPTNAVQANLQTQANRERRRRERKEAEFVRENCYARSPWPRSNDGIVFRRLSRFMERCRDLGDVMRTAVHYGELHDMAGVFTSQQDDITAHLSTSFQEAYHRLTSCVKSPVDIDVGEPFAVIFDQFRQVVKTLDGDIAQVLHDSLSRCQSRLSTLRLMRLFSGTISRDIPRVKLAPLITDLAVECQCEVDQWFQWLGIQNEESPILHPLTPGKIGSMPSLRSSSSLSSSEALHPVVDKEKSFSTSLLRFHGVHANASEMQCSLLDAFPDQSLLGDEGRQLFQSLEKVLSHCEKQTVMLKKQWSSNLNVDVDQAMKRNVLRYTTDSSSTTVTLAVNLDAQLLSILQEALQLSLPPLSVPLPEALSSVSGTEEIARLRYVAHRLETCVAQYNDIKLNMSPLERNLFLTGSISMDTLVSDGARRLTWQSSSLSDYVEKCTSLITQSVYHKWAALRHEMKKIQSVIDSWSSSRNAVDVFSMALRSDSLPIDLCFGERQHKRLDTDFKDTIAPACCRVHQTIDRIFEICEAAASSPQWQEFVAEVDTSIALGLRRAILLSLKAMDYGLQAVPADNELNLPRQDNAFLKVQLLFRDNGLYWYPAMTRVQTGDCAQEVIVAWLNDIMARPGCVPCVSSEGDFRAVTADDSEVDALAQRILKRLGECPNSAQAQIASFSDFSFLWEKDIFATLRDFIAGKLERRRDARPPTPSQEMRSQASVHSAANSQSSDSRPVSRLSSTGVMGLAEQQLLTGTSEFNPETAPFLDDLEEEIVLYETTLARVSAMPKLIRYGWVHVDATALVVFLETLCQRWLGAFKEYLAKQCTSWLMEFREFLQRVEPIIEGVSGDESDTQAFMHIIARFNEISARQVDMDEMFVAVHRSVRLLHAHQHRMSDEAESVFESLPTRFANLKKKVSLAKQKIGPRMRLQTDHISSDLSTFGKTCLELQDAIAGSRVTRLSVSPVDAGKMIQDFRKHLQRLETEAKDLCELQDLLEVSVVNFQMLPECGLDLNSLETIWDVAKDILQRHRHWKDTPWLSLDVEDVRKKLAGESQRLRELGTRVQKWQLLNDLLSNITSIQSVLPIVEMLRSPAMRLRHWKQVIRFIYAFDNLKPEQLPELTLSRFMKLNLQDLSLDCRHGSNRSATRIGGPDFTAMPTYSAVQYFLSGQCKQHDVQKPFYRDGKEIYSPGDLSVLVSKAEQEVAVEEVIQILENVWLSRNFHFKTRRRHRQPVVEEASESGSQRGSAYRSRSTRRRTSGSSSLSKLSSSESSSVLTADASPGVVSILTDVESIFETLEHHHSLLCNCATSSFSEDLGKWQKRLQTLETVLHLWMSVQRDWDEMEDIFTSSDVRAMLPKESRLFTSTDRSYKHLMREVKVNANIYQSTGKAGRMEFLEKLQKQLNVCETALLRKVGDLRSQLPVFHFLSSRDVLHTIVAVAEVDRLQRYISKIYPAAGSVAVVSFRTDNNTLTLDSGSVVQRHRAQQLQHVLSGGSSSGSPEASSLNVAAEEGPATSGAAPGHASVSRITHLISHLGERFALVSPVVCRLSTTNVVSSLGKTIQGSLQQKLATIFPYMLTGCESELTPDVMARFIAEIRDYPTQTTSIAMKLFLDSLLAKAMTANNKDVTAANDIAPDVTPPSSPAVVVEDASSGVTGDRTDLGANDKTSDTAEAATEDSTSATKTCDLAVSDDTVGKHVSEVGHDSDVTNDDVLASSVADQPAVAVSDYPVPTEDVSPAETEDEKGARTDELPGKEKDFTALRQLQAFVDQLLSCLLDAVAEFRRHAAISYRQETLAQQAPSAITNRSQGSSLMTTMSSTAGNDVPSSPPPACPSGFDDMDAQRNEQHRVVTGELLKIRNVISVLLSQRDILVELLTVDSGDASARKVHRARFSATNVDSQHDIKLSLVVDDQAIPVAYDYLGSCCVHHLDRSMRGALADAVLLLYSNPALMLQGPGQETNQVVDMLSWLQGHHVNRLPCSSMLLSDTLVNHLLGMCSQGSVLFLSDVDKLSPQLASVVIHFLQLLTKALDRGWPRFVFMGTEVPLSKQVKCILASSSSTPFGQHHFPLLQVPGANPSDNLKSLLCMAGFRHDAKLAPDLKSLIQACSAGVPSDMTTCTGKASIARSPVSRQWRRVIDLAGEYLAVHVENLLTSDSGESEADQLSSSHPPVSEEDERLFLAAACSSLLLPGLTNDVEEWHMRLMVEQHLRVKLDDIERLHLPFAATGEEKYFHAISRGYGDSGATLVFSQRQMTRVQQLLQLLSSSPVVGVAGSSCSGKSTCIRLARAVCQLSRTPTNVQWFNVNALTTAQLIGFEDEKTKLWTDGVFTRELRSSCYLPAVTQHWLVLIGKLSTSQLSLLQPALNGQGCFYVPNGEVIRLSSSVRIILETTTVSDSLLRECPSVVLRTRDVDWSQSLRGWLQTQRLAIDMQGVSTSNLLRSDFDSVEQLCLRYAADSLQWLKDNGVLAESSATANIFPLNVCATGLTKSFTTILDCTLIKLHSHARWQDITLDEVERFVSYSAMWAYGGVTRLNPDLNNMFSKWWRQYLPTHLALPANGHVFDCVVLLVEDQFLYQSWAERIAPYTRPTGGVAALTYVSTPRTAAVHYLLSLLATRDHSVMLVGPEGTGKTVMASRYMATACSGDISDTGCLKVHVNRLTGASSLWPRIRERLQWKSGRSYAPSQKRQLLILLDNLQQAEAGPPSGEQSVCELFCHFHNCQGCFSPADNGTWHHIESVNTMSIVTTPASASSSSSSTSVRCDDTRVKRKSVVSAQLVHHAVLLPLPYPCDQELVQIYLSLLKAHFEWRTVKPSDLSYYTTAADLRISPEVLSAVVVTTVEVQGRLNSMYAVHPRRCHYAFTMTTLSALFGSLYSHLPSTAITRDVLNLWLHECHWQFERRLSSDVDRERFRSLLTLTAKKHFEDRDVLGIILNQQASLFNSPIKANIDANDYTAPTESGTQHTYLPVKDEAKLCEDIERALLLHNEKFPPAFYPLHTANMQVLCRVQHILSQSAPGSHVVLVAEGNPSMSRHLISLVAYMNACSFVTMDTLMTSSEEGLLQSEWNSLTPSLAGAAAGMQNGGDAQSSCVAMPTHNDLERLMLFKLLKSVCTQCGLEDKHTVVHVTSDDIPTPAHMAVVQDLLVAGSVGHWYSSQDRVQIINAMRGTILKLGLLFSEDLAWDMFNSNIMRNVRVALTFPAVDSAAFQQCVRLFPSIVGANSLLIEDLWSQDLLVDVAAYYLHENPRFTEEHVHGVARLFVELHTTALAMMNTAGAYSGQTESRSGWNEKFEGFVTRFVQVFEARCSAVESQRERFDKAVALVNAARLRQETLNSCRDVEKKLLGDKLNSVRRVLSQLGQDTCIIQEHILLQQRQNVFMFDLRKRLPDYEMSREAALCDKKRFLSDMKDALGSLAGHQSQLTDLRTLPRVPTQVEDVMATVIVLAKSVNADQTWNRGAKRLLSNFEDMLNLLHRMGQERPFSAADPALPKLELLAMKGAFELDVLRAAFKNEAVEDLQAWAKSVRSYQIVVEKQVHPTTLHIDQMHENLNSVSKENHELNVKIEDLTNRLKTLSSSLEEASLEYTQQLQTVEKLSRDSQALESLLNIIEYEEESWQKLVSIFEEQQTHLLGTSALSAASDVYLTRGMSSSSARHLLLNSWPEGCIRRGYPVSWPFTDSGLSTDLASIISSGSKQVLTTIEEFLEPRPVTAEAESVMARKTTEPGEECDCLECIKKTNKLTVATSAAVPTLAVDLLSAVEGVAHALADVAEVVTASRAGDLDAATMLPLPESALSGEILSSETSAQQTPPSKADQDDGESVMDAACSLPLPESRPATVMSSDGDVGAASQLPLPPSPAESVANVSLSASQLSLPPSRTSLDKAAQTSLPPSPTPSSTDMTLTASQHSLPPSPLESEGTSDKPETASSDQPAEPPGHEAPSIGNESLTDGNKATVMSSQSPTSGAENLETETSTQPTVDPNSIEITQTPPSRLAATSPSPLPPLPHSLRLSQDLIQQMEALLNEASEIPLPLSADTSAINIAVPGLESLSSKSSSAVGSMNASDESSDGRDASSRMEGNPGDGTLEPFWSPSLMPPPAVLVPNLSSSRAVSTLSTSVALMLDHDSCSGAPTESDQDDGFVPVASMAELQGRGLAPTEMFVAARIRSNIVGGPSSACNKWPLIIDPDGIGANIVRHLEARDVTEKNVSLNPLPEILDAIQTAMLNGSRLLLLNVTPTLLLCLRGVLVRPQASLLRSSGSKGISVLFSGRAAIWNESFRLYMTFNPATCTLPVEVTSHVTVIDASLRNSLAGDVLHNTLVKTVSSGVCSAQMKLNGRFILQQGRLFETYHMMLGMLSDTKDDEAVPRTKRLALCQHLKNKTVAVSSLRGTIQQMDKCSSMLSKLSPLLCQLELLFLMGQVLHMISALYQVSHDQLGAFITDAYNQVVKESFGDGSEREGEEVKERDTHSALAERFLHAISTYPADEQEKLITHFIRLIFVDMTRAYSPRHRFLAALVFALMKHVAEVPSAGDFVMAAEELAMLLDGCALTLPAERILPDMKQSTGSMIDVSRLPRSLQMTRFLQLTRLRSSPLSTLPKKLCQHTTDHGRVQMLLSALQDELAASIDHDVSEETNKKEDVTGECAATPSNSEADAVMAESSSSAKQAAEGTESSEKSLLSRLNLQPANFTGLQQVLLSQVLGSPQDFFTQAEHFIGRYLGNEYLTTPQVNLNTLLQIGKPVLVLRPPSDVAEAAISDLLKAATKVYRSRLVNIRITSQSLLAHAKSTIETTLSESVSSAEAKPLMLLHGIDLAPSSWLQWLEARLKGKRLSSPPKTTSRRFRRPVSSLNVSRSHSRGSGRASAASGMSDGITLPSLPCQVVMTCSHDTQALPASLSQHCTVVSWHQLKRRSGLDDEELRLRMLDEDRYRSSSQLLNDISVVGSELRRHDWFLAIQSAHQHATSRSRGPQIGSTESSENNPTVSGSRSSSSRPIKGRASHMHLPGLSTEQQFFGTTRSLSPDDVSLSWMTVVQEQLQPQLDLSIVSSLASRSPLAFAIIKELQTFNQAVGAVNNDVVTLRHSLTRAAVKEEFDGQLTSSENAEKCRVLSSGVVPSQWIVLWRDCDEIYEAGGNVSKWLQGVKRQHSLLKTWCQLLKDTIQPTGDDGDKMEGADCFCSGDGGALVPCLPVHTGVVFNLSSVLQGLLASYQNAHTTGSTKQALIVLHGTPPRSTASCVQLTDVSLNGATWTDSDSQNSSVFAVAEQQADSDDCSGYRTIDTSAVSIKTSLHVRCNAIQVDEGSAGISLRKFH